jgi:hypothetical protein
MCMRYFWLVLVGALGALAACAPTSSPSTSTPELLPVSQAEYLAFVRQAKGTIYVASREFNWPQLAQTLAQTPDSNQANLVLMVHPQALRNPAQVNMVAKAVRGSLTSMVFVTSSQAELKPFALVGDRAFIGPGVGQLKGQIWLTSASYNYKNELEQFNRLPKRIYFAQ